MKSAYQIIQKPVITEKGLGIKETQTHGVLGGAKGNEDRNQGSRAVDF